MLLKKKGMGAETAYRRVQALCAQAIATGQHLRDLLFVKSRNKKDAAQSAGEFYQIFDLKTWVREEYCIYSRAGLPTED